MKEKVIIGMSGGVDSSVCAYLLKEQGYDVYGVTMNIWKEAESLAVEDAKRVAETLDIPHFVFDFREDFEREVITYFINEYLNGRTPNPCNVCNRKIKWEALMKEAGKLGAKYIATGHYSRISKLENGRYAVRVSKTTAKDQTYALCNLTQEQLKYTLMPLGEYTKDEVRAIAEKMGIPVAKKPDSQEICFISDNDYAGFIDRAVKDAVPKPGNFINKNGEIIGKHKGITHYTIGQRKGLNLSMGHPVFVCEIRPDTDEVVIGEAEDVFTDTVIFEDINYMGVGEIEDGERFLGKIRYAHKGENCTAYNLPDGRIKCVFDNKVRASTPGQNLVLYRDDYVACGGVIS
ncbi:MAG: tRNA 2-thiouridine(34) synthase MnmA [Lachnospiraceae bacterium]|nr:tRNA 2-thiouridine(34) synthase MnmA [Lachnospiraceae bacterium]